ncbi:hypothetical protein BJF78_30005 [Pseudonocardia sp. CNS-139]|nr:hypothetical protein BJF78_30005 [Pseudonocardia sp. CNS-139]
MAAWSWKAGEDIVFPTPAETLATLPLDAGWRTERCEAPQREATGPEGETAPVTDNVIALRRL